MLKISESEPRLSSNTFDLMAITKQQEEKIRNIVGAQNGGLRVFIHPFFEMYDFSNPPADIAQAIRGLSYPRGLSPETYINKFGILLENTYVRQYLHILHKILKKSPPLIMVGEENKHVDTTIDICRMLNCSSNILFYRTDTDSPCPNVGDFNDLATRLTSIGVTSMLVGGQYMDFEHDMFDDSQKGHVFRMNGFVPYDPSREIEGIYGCAGNFAFEMACRNFDITISLASEPYSYPV